MSESAHDPDGVPQGWQAFWAEYRAAVYLGSFSLLLIVVASSLLFKSVFTVEPIQFSRGNVLSASASAESLIMVDIEGGVVRPGVYTVPFGSRVEDVVRKAGGLSEEADRDAVAKSFNRAARVGDGVKLYIPVNDMDEMSHNHSFATTGDVNGGDDPSGSPEDTTQNDSEESQNTAGVSSISINTASQEELESLPGIGPVTAGKIMGGRPYTRLEELTEKKIVGSSLYQKIAGQISL